MPPVLTKTEREFVEDWLNVVNGFMGLEEFYEKWGSSKRGVKFYEDVKKLKAGEVDLEEFRRKWCRKADWKRRIRKMRYEVRKKYEEAIEELKLVRKFLELEVQP